MIVPFKTPLDYFKEALKENPENINKFPEIQKTLGWEKEDCDLHVYPYVHAKSAMLSMGCKNRCFFCPTAQYYQGKIYHGDPEIILPHYTGMNVHFMDEDFFQNDMDLVLPLLKKYQIHWLAMSTYASSIHLFDRYGDEFLHEHGLVCVEMGLENVALMRKVHKPIKAHSVEIYYLNMCCLPGETKETIRANAEWMRYNGLRHPIHFNNGVWYAPGQFFYPYEHQGKGMVLEGKYARTRPTYIPNTLLMEKYKIIDLEAVNHFSQLVYGIKKYPKQMEGSITDFIHNQDDACWLITGIRVGGII
jgi:hypothetical protein